jgi:hypothetical protein
MTARDVMRELVMRWDDVEPRLSEPDGRLLMSALRQFHAHPRDRELMMEVVDRLTELLPADHPILRAFDRGETRSGEPEGWSEVLAGLARIVADSRW